MKNWGIYGKVFYLKILDSHSLAIFSFTVRLREVIHVTSLDLERGVHVRSREVSTYGKLKM